MGLCFPYDGAFEPRNYESMCPAPDVRVQRTTQDCEQNGECYRHMSFHHLCIWNLTVEGYRLHFQRSKERGYGDSK